MKYNLFASLLAISSFVSAATIPSISKRSLLPKCTSCVQTSSGFQCESFLINTKCVSYCAVGASYNNCLLGHGVQVSSSNIVECKPTFSKFGPQYAGSCLPTCAESATPLLYKFSPGSSAEIMNLEITSNGFCQ